MALLAAAWQSVLPFLAVRVSVSPRVCKCRVEAVASVACHTLPTYTAAEDVCIVPLVVHYEGTSCCAIFAQKWLELYGKFHRVHTLKRVCLYSQCGAYTL